MTTVIEYRLAGVPEFRQQEWQDLRRSASGVLTELLDVASDNPSPEQMLGWIKAPEAGFAKACTDYHSENLGFFYDSVFVCGTGGSYLGCKMLSDLLPFCRFMGGQEALETMPLYHVGQHVSAYEFTKLREAMRSSQPLIVFISKSGTTFETSIGLSFLLEDLKEKFPDNYKRRIVSVSSQDLTQKPGFDDLLTQPVLRLPADVGGRFSVLASAGLAPLCFAGFDLSDLVAGAAQCVQDAGAWEPDADFFLFAADRAGLGKTSNLEMWMYGDPALEFLALWWQQLYAESEGKDQKGALPVPVQWSRDLHSVGQWLQDGPKPYWQLFVDAKSAGEFDGMEAMHSVHNAGRKFDIKHIKSSLGAAVRKAHLDSGSQQMCLSIPEWSAHCLGYFMQWSMLACAVTCKLQGINAFDQPGVEAYKKEFVNAL